MIKSFRILILSFLLLFLQNPLWAQITSLDSLKEVLANSQSPQAKLPLLIELGSKTLRRDPQSSIVYTNQALKLAIDNGHKSYEGKARINKGIFQEYRGAQDSALYHFKKAEEIFLALGDSTYYYQSIFEQGIFHNYKSNYLLSIRDFLTCLSYFERVLDTPRISKCLNNLGVVSNEIRSHEAAKEYYRRSYLLKRTTGNLQLIASTLNNLSYSYFLAGNMDSSIYFAKQSLDLQSGKNLWSLHYTHRNLAAPYLQKQEYPKALFHANKAFEIIESLGGNADMAGTLLERSQISFGMGNIVQAKKDADRSLGIMDSIDLYNNFRSDLLQHQADISIRLKNYPEAVRFLKENQVLRDSIFQQDKVAEISRLETLYETEKKEQQLEILQAEKELQEEKLVRTRQNLFWVGILSFLLLGLVIIFILLNRQRTQNNLLLKENNEYLSELNETKDQLFSIIAHDLKNPLSAFRSLTFNLAKKWDFLEKADIYPFIQSLGESSNRLYDLLQNLLEWAINQAGRFQPKIQELEAGKLLTSTLLPLRNLIQLKELQLDQSVKDGPLFFESDENIIRTVIRNLAANAIKFTPRQGRITVKAYKEGKSLLFEVADTGIGISVEDQKKLFSKENSAREIGDSPEKGSGLGLVLSKELLDKVGGQISVSSAEGKGSIFIVRIPA